MDPVVLRIAVRSKRLDRFMLVTDAMPSVGAPGKSFQLQGRTISVTDNVCVDTEGRLAARTSTWPRRCATSRGCCSSLQ